MKTLIILITLTLSTILVRAQSPEAVAVDGTTITVTVPVQSNDGTIYVGLYDESTFMKSEPIKALDSEIVDGKATVTFTDIAAGEYAITLFHDKNGNKQMDFEPNGMPKEMYGVSNNVMSYGPPQWSDAKFEVNGKPISMEIRM
ncbi:DUF2141 domain-containing protein [Aureitalea marina]|uniref:DUF2141 domain-containing protein n=1 Tax=Aureitalea marina TaxID=930804 RepID=A0A2S7KPV0_9FLAO|nr:DUF2141 domain-containing protein [Aureitalea marina]PQB04656.1 hypothetical protein BST85_06915 [Aureitalea marina]